MAVGVGMRPALWATRLSAFQTLLAEGVFAGSTALPLTNVSAGSRDSAMVGGSGRGANEVDSLTLSGVPFASSMASDADAPTDLGVGYGVDLLSCTPSFGAAGTIVQAAIPYGWSQSAHPVSQFARLFASSSLEAWVDGNITLVGSGGSPTVSSGGSFVDETPSIFAGDWDGVNIGARFDSLIRVEAEEANAPSGTLYVGNRSDSTRPFHGILATWIIDRVLTDAEYEIMRVGLTAIAQGITLN